MTRDIITHNKYTPLEKKKKENQKLEIHMYKIVIGRKN